MDFSLAEKIFLITNFNENETEKLTKAPTNANIPVRIKSSDLIIGKIANTVPPQVSIMVEKYLKGIISFLVCVRIRIVLLISLYHHLAEKPSLQAPQQPLKLTGFTNIEDKVMDVGLFISL